MMSPDMFWFESMSCLDNICTKILSLILKSYLDLIKSIDSDFLPLSLVICYDLNISITSMLRFKILIKV